jgi:hypothetical protein
MTTRETLISIVVGAAVGVDLGVVVPMLLLVLLR